MKKDRIILNRIQTPDGTILTSYTRHDMVMHKDENGETYFTDGGTAYLRRSVNDEPFEDLTVYGDEPFEVIRESFHWGTRGKDGQSKLTFKPVKDLDTDHIQAIIDDGYENVREIMEQELKYRSNK